MPPPLLEDVSGMPIFALTLEDAIVEAIRQVPALCVLVYVVYVFLKHIAQASAQCDATATKATEMSAKTAEVFGSTVKGIAETMAASNERVLTQSQVQAQKIQESMDKNTEALGRNTQALSYHARATVHDTPNKGARKNDP